MYTLVPHTHKQPFYGPFSGLYGASGDIKADTPTMRMGATPSGLIIAPPVSSPIFTLDAPLAATLPIYPGFGQAPNILACISSVLVAYFSTIISIRRS